MRLSFCFPPSPDTTSILQSSHSLIAHITDITMLCRWPTEQTSVVLPSRSQTLPSNQGWRPQSFCAFSNGQVSNKRPEPSFILTTCSLSPGKKHITRTSSKKDNFRTCYSVPHPHLFLVLARWGLAESVVISSLRKRVLLHTNAEFHWFNSEKRHYTRKYFEQTLLS